jgi:hypothetical protein
MDNKEILEMLDSIDLKLAIDGRHGRAVAKNRKAIEACREIIIERIKEGTAREFEYNCEVAKIYIDKVVEGYHRQYASEKDEDTRALINVRCNRVHDAVETIEKMRATFNIPQP